MKKSRDHGPVNLFCQRPLRRNLGKSALTIAIDADATVYNVYCLLGLCQPNKTRQFWGSQLLLLLGVWPHQRPQGTVSVFVTITSFSERVLSSNPKGNCLIIPMISSLQGIHLLYIVYCTVWSHLGLQSKNCGPSLKVSSPMAHMWALIISSTGLYTSISMMQDIQYFYFQKTLYICMLHSRNIFCKEKLSSLSVKVHKYIRPLRKQYIFYTCCMTFVAAFM